MSWRVGFGQGRDIAQDIGDHVWRGVAVAVGALLKWNGKYVDLTRDLKRGLLGKPQQSTIAESFSRRVRPSRQRFAPLGSASHAGRTVDEYLKATAFSLLLEARTLLADWQ
ncbi:MAG: hypothetical protein AAFQ44_11560 [Pseudomonadota bacterium]